MREAGSRVVHLLVTPRSSVITVGWSTWTCSCTSAAVGLDEFRIDLEAADTLFPSAATDGRAMHFLRNLLDVIGVGGAAQRSVLSRDSWAPWRGKGAIFRI
jgi:hypothetical protein